MAERPAAKPVAQSDGDWETVQPDEWQTVSGSPTPDDSGAFVSTLSGTAPWQRAIDEAATPPESGFAGQVGAGMTQLMLEPIAHPFKTIGGVGTLLAHPMHTAAQFSKSVQEHPVSGLTSAIGGELLGLPAAQETPELANTFREAVRPYRSPIVPAPERSAERLMQAISPPEGLTPANVRAAMREAPQVREYAQRTGNPLRTIPEGTKAAEGVAQEGLNHYKAHFLDPNADVRMHLPNNISPELGAGATLRQIDQRISDINDLIRGSERTAKSTGQEMTASEKLGLANEAKALRGKLYEGLAEKTGVSPDEIQNLREGYGGQFAIKNALESGHYQRLTNTGRMSQGTGNVVPLTRTGAIDRLITTLRGGPERIANRQFRNRIAAFEPQAPAYPFPRQIPAKPFEPETQVLPPRPSYPRMTENPFEPAPIPEPPLFNGPMRKAPSVLEDEHTARLIRAERNNAAAQAEREAREAEQRRAQANELTRGKRLDILAARKGLK